MKRRRAGRSKRTRFGRARTRRYPVAVPLWKRQVARSLLPPWLLSSLLLVVAGWLLYWFANDDFFYVRSVRSKGNWRLSEVELSKVSGLEGVNVFWVDTRAAERALEALSDVESARVRCGLPADCVISVVERPASLVWRQGDAQVWIGADGVAVPARGELPNAVVLDAAGSTALKPGDRLDLAVVTAVGELERLQPEVRVYQYSDRYGLSFKNAYGWQVRLGGGGAIADRLNVLHALTDYLLSQGIVPAFVDVRYPEAPYYGE